MKRILIVDDNRDLSDGLAVLLEDNFDVSIAYNGTDALKKAGLEDFDLVLLDVDLPDMNGIEIFHKLSEQMPGINIIIMTGFRIEQIIEKIIPRKEPGFSNTFLYRDEYAVAIKNADEAGMSFIQVNGSDAITSIEEILLEQGRNALIAKTKDDALSGVYSGNYDILVLDWSKSIICALDIYLALKEAKALLPIVMLINTGSEASQNVDLLKSFEVTGCIFKPYDFEEFMNLIQDVEIQDCA